MNVFEFIDFTQCIQAYVSERKDSLGGYSFQRMADELGLQSRAYIQNVISGKIGISEDVATKLCVVMNLNDEEVEYFLAMVQLRQSRQLTQKVKSWELIRVRYKGNSIALSGEPKLVQEFDYLSNWYVPVVKEILLEGLFDGDFSKAGRLLIPQISGAQFRFAVNVLEGLGLVIANGKKYQCNAEHIWVESPIKSLAIRKFQKDSALLAADSMENAPKDQRNISTMTIGTTQKGFIKIQKLISQLQNEIVSIVEQESKIEQVFNLNVQLYPVSKSFRRIGNE